jgi:hypothetical protein
MNTITLLVVLRDRRMVFVGKVSGRRYVVEPGQRELEVDERDAMALTSKRIRGSPCCGSGETRETKVLTEEVL